MAPIPNKGRKGGPAEAGPRWLCRASRPARRRAAQRGQHETGGEGHPENSSQGQSRTVKKAALTNLMVSTGEIPDGDCDYWQVGEIMAPRVEDFGRPIITQPTPADRHRPDHDPQEKELRRTAHQPGSKVK